jgi:Excalibur calcium-binding domain
MIISGAPVPPSQPPQPAPRPAGERDCLDFASQAEPQAYFESRGGHATNNLDRLDRDGDGTAYEESA